MGYKKIIIPALFLFLFIGLGNQEASAISAWARRYNSDCSMCHWQLNKLNNFGVEFLHRGHRLPGESAKSDNAYVNLSDYLSVTAKTRFKDTDTSKSTFDVEALSLYAGGPLSENYSFFYEQYLHESNSDRAKQEKLADAYLHYKTSGENRYVTARIGQIAPYLWMTHGTGARLGISRPIPLADVDIGSNPYRPRQRQYGAEAGYVMEDWKLRGYLGLVNGTGHSTPNLTDNNDYKDQYLTVEKVLDKYGSNVGLYAYNGKYPLSGFNDGFYQVALVGEFGRENYSVYGGGLYGKNDTSTSSDRNSWGGYLEGNAKIPFVDRLAGLLRYDYIDPNTDAGADAVKGPAAGLSYWLTTFARATLEGQWKETGATNSESYILEVQFMY